MIVDDLVVEVRDRHLTRIGQILPGDLNLDASALYNGVGEWTLTLPLSHPLASALRQPGSGLIVTSPDDVLFSGPVTKPEYSESVDEIAGTATFTGLTDEIVLSDMLAWPEPSNGDVQTQANAYDVRTGAAETLMHQYVDANIGPAAPAARQHYGLIMGADHGLGGIVTKQARFDTLLEILSDLGATNGIGFRIVQRGALLVFETYALQDRTATVRLSLENNELSSQKVSIAPPVVTRAIVAGTGQLTGRKFIERTNVGATDAEQLWGRRIEQFVDNRDTDLVSQLNQAGDEALSAGSSTQTGVEAIPAESSRYRYGADWFLGDTVAVRVGDVDVALATSGLVIKIDEDGTRAGIQVGDSSALIDQSAIQLSNAVVRVNQLERHDKSGLAVAHSDEAPAENITTVGDLWIQKANGDALVRWDGSTWVDVEPASIAAAAQAATDAADAAQTAQDTAFQAQVSADAAASSAQTAQDAASRAQTSADGKNTIYYGSSPPAPPENGFAEGDTWFDQAHDNQINKRISDAWVPIALGTVAIADDAITSIQIAPQAVRSEHVAPAAITSVAIAPFAVAVKNLRDSAHHIY